ncbi:MAG: tetratricopeptide repeat protein [Bacteroidia bacterium]|nr:tetratricopeptide repeat protein [Bacteroidia bacterium]
MNKAFLKYISYLLFISLAILFACTTEKNTFVTRTYHNVTAKYNVYFNGNESFKKGTQKLYDSYKDNYSRILPVFTYSDEAAAKSVTQEMDKTIKKASKLIKYHSIKVKPKQPSGRISKRKKEFLAKTEYCKWVDDAYLLMGKAHFYKHDYFQARINFEYIIVQYKNEEIRYYATLWLVRTMLETNQFNKAKETLDLLDADKKLPRKIKGEMASIYADYYLKQKNYEEATTELRKAIDKTGKKRLRTRYKFILAQIYQKLGEYKNASNLYAQVIKMNPPYDMAFNAKINRATCFDVESGDSREIKKQLEKMLKDGKNKDYQDQIYYAIANIYFKENSIDEALKNYKLSVLKSISNNDQKSVSYLAIADIYFSKLDYRPSQAYYDSCVAFLDRKYPDYDKIFLKTANLNELIENLNIVDREDSLQKVAKMPEKERFRFIDNLIEKVKEEEAKKKEEERQRQLNMMFDAKNQGNTQQSSSGKWYFYNPSTLSSGFAEFARKWGNRKIEDNWRRKNKTVVLSDDLDNNSGNSTDSTKTKPLSNKTREYYLRNLPITDSLMTRSHQKIKDALYKLGRTYKDKLQDYPKSIGSYENLNKRYPKNEYLLTACYELFLLNKLIKNQSQTDAYKNQILSNFPDSKYAKILQNPNYLDELMTNSKLAEEIYVKTFDLFKKGNYPEVIKNCETVENSYPENRLVPQFAYMKAVSYGKSTSNDNLKNELNALIKKYPNSEIVVPAQDILTYLQKGSLSDIKQKIANDKFYTDTINTVSEVSLYSYAENAPHYYVLILPNTKAIDANRISFDVSNFNIDNYGMANYNVSAIMLNKEFHIISVKSFANKIQGMSYYNSIKNNPEIFKDIAPNDYRQFIISADNFAALFKDQDVGKYVLFFTKKYLE